MRLAKHSLCRCLFSRTLTTAKHLMSLRMVRSCHKDRTAGERFQKNKSGLKLDRALVFPVNCTNFSVKRNLPKKKLTHLVRVDRRIESCETTRKPPGDQPPGSIKLCSWYPVLRDKIWDQNIMPDLFYCHVIQWHGKLKNTRKLQLMTNDFFDVGLFMLLSEDTVIYDLHINFSERSEIINHWINVPRIFMESISCQEC